MHLCMSSYHISFCSLNYSLFSCQKVAGHFTYGVMTLSAATFMFWNAFGSKILPLAFQQGSPISLALQLSCSVLVWFLVSLHKNLRADMFYCCLKAYSFINNAATSFL